MRLRSLPGGFARLLRDRRGVAATEMALGATLFTVMLLGLSETALYVAARYRTAEMATTVADVVSRYEAVTASDIEAMLAASSAVIQDKDFPANGLVILSAVSRPKNGGEATVVWQCRGGGSFAATSRVGDPQGKAVLPGDLLLDPDDNAIVAEVFYDYASEIGFALQKRSTFYDTAVFRPRLGALSTVPGCQ